MKRHPVCHARMQKALSEGVQLAFCFRFVSVDEGREDKNTTISGPSLARHFAGVPMMAQHCMLAW